MAETVHMFLKASGQEIKGFTSQKGGDLANSIECISYDDSTEIPQDARLGGKAAMHSYKPIVIHKLIDIASPLIAKALKEGAPIEAEFRFFKPGAGNPVPFFSVKIAEARIQSISRCSPDATDQKMVCQEPFERVTFTFKKVTYSASDPDDTASTTEFADDLTAYKAA